jgi:hypothetical protein
VVDTDHPPHHCHLSIKRYQTLPINFPRIGTITGLPLDLTGRLHDTTSFNSHLPASEL